MKGIIVSKKITKAENNVIFSFVANFFIRPFISGLYGFILFFTVLILTKGFSYILGFTEDYIINSEDILFSLLGLIIVFMIKLSENIKNKIAN